MRQSIIAETFKSSTEKIWDIAADNSVYNWRSDLSKILITEDGNRFKAYIR